MISHTCSYMAAYGFALSLTRGLRLESELRVGTFLPMLYHVGDQPFTYSVFLSGGTLILGRKPDPGRIAEMIAEERVTALWAGSPAMVIALDKVLTQRPELDAHSLKVIVYGWAALPPATRPLRPCCSRTRSPRPWAARSSSTSCGPPTPPTTTVLKPSGNASRPARRREAGPPAAEPAIDLEPAWMTSRST
jgi:hypothetical protein